MAKWGEGNPPAGSTEASLGSNPSSGALLAEVAGLVDAPYEVRYFLGASTHCIWRCQQALSTGLGSTAIVDETAIFTPANQSGEYVIRYNRLAPGVWSTAARFRVLASTAITAQIGVKIFAEPLV